VPKAAATCDGKHSLVTAAGVVTTDCTPYACDGTTCKSSCKSIDDCVFPNECSSANTCVPPPNGSGNGGGGGGGGGCGCGVPGSRPMDKPFAGGALLGLFALAMARRSRART
jgi:hypothetical protein